MSAWIWLLLAGLVEIAFSQSIKPTQGFTKVGPTVVCVLLGAASIAILSRAMQTIPVGTAYAIFTGIGAIGAVTLGIVLSGDPVTPARIGGLSMIIGGVVLCHLAETGQVPS